MNIEGLTIIIQVKPEEGKELTLEDAMNQMRAELERSLDAAPLSMKTHGDSIYINSRHGHARSTLSNSALWAISRLGVVPKQEESDMFVRGIGNSEKEKRRQLLESAKSSKGGFTYKALKSLGIPCPPTKGWAKRFINGED